MSPRNRLFFSLALVLAACGGISDPNQPKSGAIRAGTVTGALQGSAPANARVAVVWRKGARDGFAPAADAPIVNGKFTLDISVPADDFFFDPGSDLRLAVSDAPLPESGGAPQVPDAPSASPGSAPGLPSGSSRPLTNVSGSVSEKLTIAVAGFVVYADSNGNGKLDLEGPTASSTDEILGGNDDLMLTYFRNGGALDLEKLRDRSGIAPIRGLNLLFDETRWVGLDMAELTIDPNARLPGGVCQTIDEDVVAIADTKDPDSVGPGPLDIVCAPDGRSYTYRENATCSGGTTIDAGPPGLCNAGYAEATPCAAVTGARLAPDAAIPENWPCPISGGAPIDGGAAPKVDAGAPVDAGSPNTDAG